MTEITDDNAGNPVGDARDAELVELGGAPEAGQMASVEMMRRLKRTIADQQASTNALNERIRRLNLWLLVVTVAIGVLTAAQVYAVFWGTNQQRLWVLWREFHDEQPQVVGAWDQRADCERRRPAEYPKDQEVPDPGRFLKIGRENGKDVFMRAFCLRGCHRAGRANKSR